MNFFTLPFSRVLAFNFVILISLSGLVNAYGQTCNRSEFRTIDGTCNNLKAKDWGKAGVPFLRVLPAVYEDNRGKMLTSRPNPREISNKVLSQKSPIPNKSKLSSFVFTWAQFIDHDMDITPVNQRDRASIPLPANEPNFSQDISFSRSEVVRGTGRSNNREHPNNLTAWMDGSQVYGSDAHRANWLRTFSNGKLKTSSGNYLPYNTIDGERNSSIDPNAPEMDDPFHSGQAHSVAGDIRAGEQPGLTILHTLFLREHNRICDELKASGMRNDEKIYQTARKRVGALIQHITYNEFLPALGIKMTTYKGYDAKSRPDIMHVFATAAYRIGHTMVTDELLLLENDCTPTKEPLSLGQAFFNPRWIQELGIEPIIKGLASQKQELIDAQIVNSLRNSLFNIPRLPTAVGLDLASINIQRGRDHGLPDYNSIRAYFTGSRVSKFDQITKDRKVSQPLAEVYGNDINNIDPWVGMLAEDHFQGGNLGITMHNILMRQFENVRNGDFYFYENDPFLDKSALRTIKQTLLSTVIQNNTSLRVQTHVFRVTGQKCNSDSSTADNGEGNNGKGNNGNTSNNSTTLCDGISIEFVDGGFILDKSESAHSYFQVFSASWKSVYKCMSNCRDRHEVTNLKIGNYQIIVYDNKRRVVCTEKIRVSSKGKRVIAEIPKSSLASVMTTPQSRYTSLIFPNPAKEEVYLSLMGSDIEKDNVSINIYNNFGQLVRQLTSVTLANHPIPLTTSSLKSGMYQVQVVYKDGYANTHKLIIQR